MFEDNLYFAIRPARKRKVAVSGSTRSDPTWIGRFDLNEERMLEPIDVYRMGDRGGTLDLLAHPSGRVYFTTAAAAPGYATPRPGSYRRFGGLGGPRTLLAHGPGDSILAAGWNPERREISIVQLDVDGRLLDERRFEPGAPQPSGLRSLEYDRARDEIWVLADLSAPARSRRLFVTDLEGRQLRRVDVRIDHLRIDAAGTKRWIENVDRDLFLASLDSTLETSAALRAARRVRLDARFSSGLDSVRDLSVGPNGDSVVTRSSGWIHLVGRSGSTVRVRMPVVEAEGGYVTAVARGDRLCATYCGGVTVACRQIPAAR